VFPGKGDGRGWIARAQEDKTWRKLGKIRVWGRERERRGTEREREGKREREGEWKREGEREKESERGSRSA
jgi:hypothetical protein